MPSVEELQEGWNKEAAKLLVGHRIVSVAYMANAHRDEHGWDRRALVITLDNGTIFYPSQDDEGNGPGALFGAEEDGDGFTLPVF